MEWQEIARNKINGRSVIGLRWATLNQVMFYVSFGLISVFLSGSLVLLMLGSQWPDWSTRWFWPIALAAVVGYMTNYVAVQMLFLPYRRDDFHWLRVITLWFWRQGVVPARKPEIAEAAGEQFASQVLTPERIGKELVKVAEKVLDDPDIRHRIRMLLGPMIRRHLPSMVEKLTPEIMDLLTKAVKSGVKKEYVVQFVEEVLAPWLVTRETRERFVDLIINALRNEAPRIVQMLRQAVEQYSDTSLLRRLAYRFSEWIGLVDWQEVRHSLKQFLASPQARHQVYDMLGGLIVTVVEMVRSNPDLQNSVVSLTERMRDVFGEKVEEFLRTYLPEMGNRLADSPAFWNWLAHEALPEAKPYVTAWLEQEGGGQYVAEKFDISSRVRDAINELEIEDVHGMVNKVSGNELGAIQVLGFVLGGIAGCLMAGVLTLAEPPDKPQPDRLLDQAREQTYDRSKPGVVP
jgi:uncharacterized membrane protein YheB (UPF0754 family)